MKILIIEDSRLNRVFLARGLIRNGHEVIEAEDGLQGVTLFNTENPDLVLMDLMMPVMDGYTAVKEIRKIDTDRFIPIIVLTALTDTASLVKAIECGADDYLTKPYNLDEIHAKIVALSRISSLHETINENRKILLRNKEKMDEDLSVAEHIYKSVLNLNREESGYIRNVSFVQKSFSGEIILFTHTPSGGIHVFMGDFSGHGLSAAIGAIPASEVFYGFTDKGYSIRDIALELNSRLKKVLPGNMSCRACLIEIDKNRTAIGIWNSGMPHVVVRGKENNAINVYPSNKENLGSIDENDFGSEIDVIPVVGNEKIYLSNHEILSISNDNMEEFSSSAYMKTHESLGFNEIGLESIIGNLSASLNSDTEIKGSCVSLTEINLDKALDNWSADHEKTRAISNTASTWSVDLSFDASCLRVVNPVPAMLDVIMNIQAPHGHKERLFTILTELFSNAQEHGLLGLDSALKNSPTGFCEYYSERERRLSELAEGEISVDIRHAPNSDGGTFTIVVTDSGNGFSKDLPDITMSSNTGFSGRGMPLIKSMCDKLTYNEKGNQATAIYSWCN